MNHGMSLPIRCCWMGIALLVMTAPTWVPAQNASTLDKAVELYAAEKYEDAAFLLQQFTSSHPDAKEGFFWLGRTQLRLQNQESAKQALRRYLELAPNGDVQVFRDLAALYERNGEASLALLYYRKALDLEPRNTTLREAVARLDRAGAPPALDSPAAAGPAVAVPAEAGGKRNRPPDEELGFWKKGLAGVCQARRVWWGRLLAVVLFAFWLINSSFGLARNIRASSIPRAGLLSGAVPSVAILYILYWGVPINAVGWLLMGLSCLISLTVAAARSG